MAHRPHRGPGAGRSQALPPARKSLGQHFLRDAKVLDRIAGALELTGTETVIEIGPGRGALTDRLAERAGRLIAIEVDKALIPVLRARYADRPNVIIAEGDVLTFDLAGLAQGPYRLAGNVPYYITTPILFHALKAPRPERAVFLVQREVAERMAATPGSDAYGALSVNLQALATAETTLIVKPASFEPPPKVDSAVVRVVPRAEPLVSPDEEAPFSRFVIACFAQRRKQLGRTLRTVTGCDAEAAQALAASLGLDPTVRGETLDPATFVRLFRATRALGGAAVD
ncbi:MAG: ribosomal RNA small subunit methyltransferase A [Gemmatimonadetes bacterium]|nr:ribosomal RNA small subunit methyltransferase A [Gemmatimonadota bacterium]